MCNFTYFHSASCGHQTIEISYCTKTVWVVGFSGLLRPCAEKTHSSLRIDHPAGPVQHDNTSPYVRVAYWYGQSNFCRNCEDEFKMENVRRLPTYDDVPMIPWSQAASPETAIPLFSWKMGDPLLFPQVASPADQSSSNEPEIKPNPPFIYRPGLQGTIAQLLGIEAQLVEEGFLFEVPKGKVLKADLAEDRHEAELAIQTTLYNPPSIDVYDFTSAADVSNLWTKLVCVDGVKDNTHSFPCPYFSRKGGFTILDLAQLKDAMNQGITLQNLWLQRFEPRGIRIEVFRATIASLNEIQPNQNQGLGGNIPAEHQSQGYVTAMRLIQHPQFQQSLDYVIRRENAMKEVERQDAERGAADLARQLQKNPTPKKRRNPRRQLSKASMDLDQMASAITSNLDSPFVYNPSLRDLGAFLRSGVELKPMEASMNQELSDETTVQSDLYEKFSRRTGESSDEYRARVRPNLEASVWTYNKNRKGPSEPQEPAPQTPAMASSNPVTRLSKQERT